MLLSDELQEAKSEEFEKHWGQEIYRGKSAFKRNTLAPFTPLQKGEL